jgi:predicted AAA+ superfamily ATPase
MSVLPPRKILPFIIQDLEKKMVFLGGPRQVGKTTLAQSLIENYSDGHLAYLNWDLAEHRKKIRNRDWPSEQNLIVLDEIHKSKGWRNLIKGFYDTLKHSHKFLITGSARLDHYRKGGDSLLGRYFYYRLCPYTLGELGYSRKNLDILLQYGGFPEMLSSKDLRDLRRWHTQRIGRLIKDDLRDLYTVKDLDKLEQMAEELPRRVGSPLSITNLAHDLEIDFKTSKRWIGILGSLYYSFLVPPFGSPKIKAVKKEQKLYLWDWTQIENPGIRFENLVACSLLSYCHFLEDTEGHKMELRYLRDTNAREVDFVVLKNKKPEFAVEAKFSDSLNLSPHLDYFRKRTNIPKFYQVHVGDESRQIEDNLKIIPFTDFCKEYGV